MASSISERTLEKQISLLFSFQRQWPRLTGIRILTWGHNTSRLMAKAELRKVNLNRVFSNLILIALMEEINLERILGLYQD